MSEHGQQEQAAEQRRPDDIDALYPGRFLKAADLGGKEMTVTIVDVFGEDLEGEKGKKPKAILVFDRLTRPAPGTAPARELVLPKICSVALKAMFGDKRSDWIGKRVVLFATNKLMPMAVGPQKNKPCVRVWGSPDIERDFDVSFQPPRRKTAILMTMHAVGAAAPATASVARSGVRHGGAAAAYDPASIEAEYRKALEAAQTSADLVTWSTVTTVNGWDRLTKAVQDSLNARFGEREVEMMKVG